MASGLPVILKLDGQRCVIVGGGSVAVRRAASLLDVAAKVTVIAPNISPAITALTVQCETRAYAPGDLDGATLVVIATDDPQVNAQVAADAQALGILVNRADDPEAGNLTIPAHAHHGPVTIAVHTHGISASASATIRRQLSDALDPDWPRLLTAAEAFRKIIQDHISDPNVRHDRLRQITDEQAMDILKQQGEAMLRKHLHQIAQPPPPEAPQPPEAPPPPESPQSPESPQPPEAPPCTTP